MGGYINKKIDDDSSLVSQMGRRLVPCEEVLFAQTERSQIQLKVHRAKAGSGWQRSGAGITPIRLK